MQDQTIKRAYQQLLGQFECSKITSLLFTTFNFSSQFFERNVLPLLSEPYDKWISDDNETSGQLSRLQINELLQQTVVTVISDRATNPNQKGHYRYGLLTVGLDTGFFHPKIIVATGTFKDGSEGAMLMVGSCNLTLSGWGLNREVVGLCRVGAQQRDALTPLLAWIQTSANAQIEQMEVAGIESKEIKEEGDIRANLTNILQFINTHCNQPLANEPTLHTRIPYKSTEARSTVTFLSTLLAPLPNESKQRFNSAQIVSPYWSKEHSLAPLFKELNSDNITFVPAINNQGQYLFPQSVRDHLSILPFKYDYKHFEDSDRYTHAKSVALQIDQTVHYWIGSANFTHAAMGPMNQGNIEAMLSYSLPLSSTSLQTMIPIDEQSMQWANESESDETMPSIPPISPWPATIGLTRLLAVH